MFSQAGRPAFFGGGPAWLFYALAVVSLLIFARNLSIRLNNRGMSLASAGRPWLLPLGDGPQARGGLDTALVALARVTVLTLALGSLLWNLHRYFLPFLRGQAYIAYALALDIAGGLLLLALLGLIVQRLWRRGGGGASGAGLGLMLWVGLSGLGAEYARLAATRPDWAWAEFLGWLPVVLWSSWGGPPDKLLMIIWWAHALPALVLVAWLPCLRL
jgi:hypothetical protein